MLDQQQGYGKLVEKLQLDFQIFHVLLQIELHFQHTLFSSIVFQ